MDAASFRGSGRNGTASSLAIHIERQKLECGAIFYEITIIIYKQTFLRLVVHVDPGQPPPYQLLDEPCS